MAAAIAALAAAPAVAGQSCAVVGIADGDTLTVRCADRTLKVRLAEIDAPERGQAPSAHAPGSASPSSASGSSQRSRMAIDCYGRTAPMRRPRWLGMGSPGR